MAKNVNINLFNELNEATKVEVKKKVLMESDGVRVIEEATDIVTGDLSKDVLGAEADKRNAQYEKDYEKDLQYVKDIMAGRTVIDDKYHEELDLDTAKKWLKKDYIYLNNLLSADPDEIDKKLAEDLPEIFGNKVEEAAPINSDLKKGKEERLASLKTQLEQDGDQLADDEKAAIEEEIAKLEGEVYSDETDLDEAEEIEEAEELNEEVNGDVLERLKHGDDVYFRDENGQALMCHYSENYQDPEDYDEGYKPEYGGSEEALAAAKEAAENREVWEFVEIDEETLEPTGTIYGYAYGEQELRDNVDLLREVKVIKRLEENITESEEPKEAKIVEAEVKGLKEVKSQGNIFMLEDETNKFIVGENYNKDEGLIESAEIYDNKEDADADYLKRCDITRDGEKLGEE